MQARRRLHVSGVRLASVDQCRLLPQVRGVRETATARGPSQHDGWAPAAHRRQRAQAAGAGLPGAGRTGCSSRHVVQLMQVAVRCMSPCQPVAASVVEAMAEWSSSPRRGGWDSSSTVASPPQCGVNDTVDRRDRPFGPNRLGWSESVAAPEGRRRVEAQIRVNARILRGTRPATGCRKQPQSRMPSTRVRMSSGHHYRAITQRFAKSPVPIEQPGPQGITGPTIGEDSRLTYALFEIPHKPPEAAYLLAPGHLNELVITED